MYKKRTLSSSSLLNNKIFINPVFHSRYNFIEYFSIQKSFCINANSLNNPPLISRSSPILKPYSYPHHGGPDKRFQRTAHLSENSCLSQIKWKILGQMLQSNSFHSISMMTSKNSKCKVMNSEFWRQEAIQFKNGPSFLSVSVHKHNYATFFDQIKGFFGKKKETPSATVSEEVKNDAKAEKAIKESAVEEFTPDTFLQYLKQVVRFGKLTEFGIGLPKDKEKLALLSMNRQIQIFESMTSAEKEKINHLEESEKMRIAKQASCTVTEVKLVIDKFDWFKRAFAKVKQREKEGKTLPKSMQEMEALMGGSFSAEASRSLLNDPSQPVSRNALCPCGSKKKYKRCCGS